jgi:hypothetical protein
MVVRLWVNVRGGLRIALRVCGLHRRGAEVRRGRWGAGGGAFDDGTGRKHTARRLRLRSRVLNGRFRIVMFRLEWASLVFDL